MLAAVGLLVLIARPDRTATAGAAAWPWLAAADTDSVAVPDLIDPTAEDFVADGFGLAAPDTIDVDSLAADTTEVDSTLRARTYFQQPARTGSSVSIVPPFRPGIRGRLGTYWRRDVTLDSAAYVYRVRESVGDTEVRAPAEVSLSEFLAARRTEALGDQFRTLAAQRSDRQQARRSGFGFAVDIPGGEQSAFRTLFGKNEVALTVNGTSNVNLGVRYDRNDLQDALARGGSPFAPDFGQELNLNVAGTIGDKLAINVNYDTQSQFDFENQVSLVYTGYEDDIIQRIEAGNVFLQTPATLIRGGQRLFGLRTDLQFGPLAVTAVASQQDAETVDRVFEGGADAQTFSLAPYEYEDNTHLFLGYAFHNWWDRAHERPQNPQLPPGAPGQGGFRRFVGIEVWKHEPGLINSTQEGVETTWAVALADLGEPTSVLDGGEAYLGAFDPVTGQYANEAAPLPNPALDQYPDAVLDGVRVNGATATVETITAGLERPLPASGAFANNVFRRLRANIDYTFDAQLGWISLATSVTDSDLIAVAYQYETLDGRLVTVGDYGRPAQSTSQTGPRTILKLIRSDRATPIDPLWDLTMRNIYRVGGRSLNPTTFELGITYKPAGSSAGTTPPAAELSFEQRTFLEVLGLDRVNEQGLANPDDVFDFSSGVTVNPDNGRVIFPVRQPFGDYLRNLIETGWTVGTIGAPSDNGRIVVSTGSLTPAQAVAKYVPTLSDGTEAGESLYDLTSDNARRRLPRLSDYRVEGQFKSATQSVFNIGFQLVEGTVRVTSGDLELVEGTDYRVNYTAGTVEITNPQYLLEGQRVAVSVEQNKFFSIGSKTLLGLRADYRLSEDFGLGATWMRLSERPLGDKFRVGEEALNNSIVGFDGAFRAEPRWLTRAIDALPLIQTRAPSRLEFRGEVARLNPGHPQTFAYDRTRDALRDQGLDFAEDEQSGVSYVDDFEGSENAYTALRFTDGWRIAAPPEDAGPEGSRDGAAQEADVTDPILRSNWRGLFTWYTLTESVYRGFNQILSPATEPIPAVELFPERPYTSSREEDLPLDLLDLYFDPTRRGPYNFNRTVTGGEFVQQPEDVWGGFIRSIESSYSNFDGQNNIEFVELLVSPLGGRNGTEPIAEGARLYLDLGRLNEDVLPNGFLNSEDGLQNGDAPVAGEVDAWSRRPTGRTNGFVDFFDETERTEDLGLDGLPSTNELFPTFPYAITEVDQFRPFLDALAVDSPEQRRAAQDPAADDYYNFADNRFNDQLRYPGTNGASVQERYAHYYPAYELNSAVAQQRLLADGRGVSVQPNTEDINNNNTLDQAESFHRYEIPLDAAGIAASPFFLNTLSTTNSLNQTQTWYLLRIPVRTQNKTEIGGIAEDDFSRVEAVRLWTTGHDRPATLRIASFELVGSQWLKSEEIGFVQEGTQDDPAASGGLDPMLFIESVNNEENASIYAIPKGTIQNTARTQSGSIRATREQALVFRAEGLSDGRRAALARSYATRPLDLTKYSNLRTAIHGDGFARSDSMRVFLRFGDDETENYYEIEQPVYPFDPQDLALVPGDCPIDQPFNCAKSDSLWQTNVMVGGERVDLNPINVVLSELNRAKLERDRSGRPLDERFTLSDPEGAPPGATITVRGQPSIQDIRTVVLGVRNGPGGAAVVDTVSIWFNELRVTGYDEGGGASGFLTATVALADVASLNARVSFTDDGFGELGGALGGRNFAQQTAFTLSSSFNAHKLLPERFGWSIPLSYSLTQNGSTPRFDPDNGDVRLDDLVQQAREAEVVEGSTALPPDLRADAILERARTQTASQSVRVQVSKNGSRSPWLRYTVDGLSASYSRSMQSSTNPSSSLNESDGWTGTLNYRVTVPDPLAVKPFWFTRSVPLLGRAIGGLRLNLLPSNLTLATDAQRSLSATQQRLGSEFLSEPDSISAFRALTRRSQRFEHGRQMNLQYTPFPFLQMSFGSDTDQDLGEAGQREQFRVLVRERDGGFARVYDLSPAGARSDTSIVYRDLVAELDGFNDGDPFPSDRVEILGGSDLQILPLGEALSNVFNGQLRTRQYTQQATASLRVNIAKQKWLSWLQLQPISVSTNYQWRDQPSAAAPDLEVASAGASASVQSSLRIAPRTFWRLFPFYRSWERPAAASDSSSGFDPARLARRVFVAATGIDDITVTYRGASTTATGGLDGQAYSLLSGLTGAAPSLGYRLGLSREIGIDQRIANDAAFNTFSDLLGANHDVDVRTQLSPFRGLSVGLSLRTAWGATEEIDFQIPEGGGDPIRSVGRRSGQGESTVFAFGGSYDAIVARHAERYDANATPNADGIIVSEFLSPTGYADDFAAELGRGFGAFGPNGLFPIPLPNWNVTYSGLERLPLIRKIANQVSLQHGYSATSQTGFATIFDPDARLIQLPSELGGDLYAGAAALSESGYDEATSVTVNERFQPLVGMSFGFKRNIQASLSTNRTSLYTLSTPSASVFKRTSRDLRVDLSYARTGLRLFGLRGVNNQIRLQLTALIADDETFTGLPLQVDVLNLLQGRDLAIQTPTLTSRFQLSPQISYTVSSQVTANLIAQYEQTTSEVAGTTNRFTGGVSLRILFSN
ncbi:cell surface protein SprA [Rubrivirga sp. SAORIC476]|uniref:T9SS outer membrane translocon Sov/SprA n=1 Tax=Rubrivirga sp. SAORIC476 TaxID=1961794 RepID=UPI000BCD9631|nr:cell surface protein SprA [Rubrivirga sp. SAORIC476]PAP79246.1 cell surface protein SprA [Rubrivirga sp. SAORIC476]